MTTTARSWDVGTRLNLERSLTLLIVTHPTQAEYENETHLLIDTARHVLLKIEHWHAGKATQTTKFDDFVEVAGCWWARKIETFNDKNERTAVTTQTVKEHVREPFEAEVASELAQRFPVQFIRMPLPKLDAAKNAVAARTATFEDKLVLSVRTTVQDAEAGEMLRQVVGKLGRAGGHDRRAGGTIALASTAPSAVEEIQAELRRRLLKTLHIDEFRGQRLVSLREMLQNLQG